MSREGREVRFALRAKPHFIIHVSAPKRVVMIAGCCGSREVLGGEEE